MRGWLVVAAIVAALTVWGWHMQPYPQVPAAHATVAVQVHQAPPQASPAASGQKAAHHVPHRLLFRPHRVVRWLHPRRWLPWWMR